MKANEDKAKQLYHKYRDMNFAPESAAFNAAMEMAQWKDEQLANCIECLEKEYIRNSGKGLYDNSELAARLATLKRIEEEMK